jgi:alpha-amylase
MGLSLRLSRPGRTITGLAVALVAGAALAYPIVRVAAPARAATAGPNDVIANRFMWPWPSVASECTNVLGPKGYGAVQVAPPEDSIEVSGHPWWEIYQPAAYDLTSRMGNRSQFAAMVGACHAAGVKVYSDVVVNHMTGVDQTSTTSYGGAVFNNQYSYPTAGYGFNDFHHYPANCPNSDLSIQDWNNQTQVQECQLLNLADLNTETDYVRSHIAGYLNDLMGLGVDGFRVDAAKHINQNDMAAIKAKFTNPNVFFAQEVFPGSSGNLAPGAFLSNGSVLEFTYADDLKGQFLGNIANLQTFGPSWGLQPSDKSMVFVENHDTERDGSTLNFTYGATDTLANVFMLAWNFGTPEVMSSFSFPSSNTNQSPPADSNGFVTPVTCGSAWLCQHRTRAIANMVGFHNATRGDPVGNWWSDGSNVIAFSRGADGWIGINNETGTLGARTFATGLPAGVYCDVIHGDFAGGTCGGATVTVDSAGNATVGIAAKDAVAIDVAARLGGTPSPGPSTASPTASASPTGGTGQPAVTFSVSGAPSGNPVYLVGSVTALGNWNTGSAIPMTENGSTWSTTVSLPASTAVEYKYITKTSGGTVTWEADPNHSTTTPASGAVTLNDTWHGSTAGTVAVSFAENATTFFGQNVFVVGSIPALGNWNPASAVPLSSATYPVWRGTVNIAGNTAFQYKYIKKNPDASVTWESDPNRSYTTGASGSVTLNDIWR